MPEDTEKQITSGTLDDGGKVNPAQQGFESAVLPETMKPNVKIPEVIDATVSELPDTGLMFKAADMATAIVEGKKTLLVQAEKSELDDQDLLLISKGFAVGAARIGEGRKVTESEFEELKDQHLITKELRAQLAKDDESWKEGALYVWPIQNAFRFESELAVQIPENAGTVVKELDVTKRGPFGRWGGSARYATWLASRLPKHKKYVETFAGAASVLFTKEPSETEVLADLDTEIVNAFNAIKALTDKDIKTLESWDRVVTRDKWKRVKTSRPAGQLARLHRLLYLSGGGWSSSLISYNVSRDGRIAYQPKRLLKFRERLQNVIIEHSDWQQTIKKHGGKDTLFFIDPPYPKEWKNTADDIPNDDPRRGESVSYDDYKKALVGLKGQYIFVIGDQKDHKSFLKGLSNVDIKSFRGLESSHKGMKSALRYFAFTKAVQSPKTSAEPTSKVLTPSDGLILTPLLMATSVIEGKKTLIVKTRELELDDKDFLLLSQGKALGVVRVGKGKKIDDKEFTELEAQHLITAAMRKDWCEVQPSWCKGPLYLWPISVTEKFDKPRETNVETGPQVVVSDVTIHESKKNISKAIWGSPAGKTKIANRLVAMLHAHTTYVEPFVGSGAVLFEKEPSKTEAINDADPEIAEAFKTLKGLTKEQLDKLKKKSWVGDKKTYISLAKATFKDEIDRVHRFLYMAKFSYGRMRGSFAPDTQGRSSGIIQRVEKLAPRLKNVQVFGGDYEVVVKKFDGTDTMLFLDPPYPGYDVKVGESKFDEEHFLEVLKGIKGKFLITYGVRGKLPGLLKETTFKVKRIRPARTIRDARGVLRSKLLTQLLISNYDVVAKNFDGGEWIVEDWTEKMEAASKIENVEEYDPIAAGDAQLRDDFRIVLAWYATWKESQGAFVHSLQTIEKLLIKIINELVKRGPEAIQFNPREMAPSIRAFFQQVAQDTKVPREMFKSLTIAPGIELTELSEPELDTVHKHLHSMFDEAAVAEQVVSVWKTEDIVNLHASVADLLYQLGSGGHPPPPDNGLDELSADFELHAGEQQQWWLIEAEKRCDQVRTLPLESVEVEKQKDLYMEVPPENKTYRYSVQNHFRGKSLHSDIRMALKPGKLLIGWTLNTQIAGAVKEPVVTLAQAKSAARNMNDISKINWNTGEWAKRPKAGTDKLVRTEVLAERKAPSPWPWIDVEGKTKEPEPGKPPPVGGTRKFPGVFHIVDQGKVEYGAQKAHFHEYFFHGKALNYRMFFRLLRMARKSEELACESCGTTGPALAIGWADDNNEPIILCKGCTDEFIEKQGVVLPPSKEQPLRDATAWLAIYPDDQTPYVLSDSAVKDDWMPPDGASALPSATRKQIPEQYRYWGKSGAKAKQLRDELVGKIKDGEVKLDVEAPYKKVAKASLLDSDFVLQEQTWSSPGRVGLTRTRWWVRLDIGKPELLVIDLQRNPIDNEKITARIERDSHKDSMELSGNIPPGHYLNPTKETPSTIEVLDKGKAEVLELTDDLVKVRFRGKKLNRLYALKRNNSGYLWEPTEATPKTKVTEKKVDFELFIPIDKFWVEKTKDGKEKRLVTGIVLEPNVVDAQDDFIKEEAIEKAAHDFLREYNKGTGMGVMHRIFGDIGIELVESFVAPIAYTLNSKNVKKGSWVMTVHVGDDKRWKEVKDGKLTGFSVGGVATVAGD